MTQSVNKPKTRKLNLKNDIVFKAFFSRKGNEKFLIDFLEALLKIKIRKIEIREEVNLEQLTVDEKGGRLDLQAVLDNGVIVNIELQLRNEYNIEQRTTYYSSKVISRETERGTDYEDIKKVIMINILNYEILPFEEYISETSIVLDKHREYEVLKGIKWYFVELPKFRRSNPDMNEKLNQWLAIIDDSDKGMIKVAEEKNDTMKKARVEMNYLTGDEEVRRLAELREKWEMDRVSAINYADKKGEERGSKETKEKIVKAMLKEKMSVDLISKITGISQVEIKKMK